MRVDHDGSEGSHNAAAASSPRHASPILPCTSYEQCLVGSASWTYSKARFRSAIFSRYGTLTLHGNCNMVDEDPGYGLFLLEAAAARTVLTWYAQDIISFADAHRLQELGNRHIRVVTGAGHCLNSAPRPGRFYDYYAGKHQLAGFANSSNRPNAFLRDVGSYSILETYHALTPGPIGIEIFLGYNF